MGRIDVEITDVLEKKFRTKIVQVFGGKQGDLTKAVAQAIEDWVRK